MTTIIILAALVVALIVGAVIDRINGHERLDAATSREITAMLQTQGFTDDQINSALENGTAWRLVARQERSARAGASKAPRTERTRTGKPAQRKAAHA